MILIEAGDRGEAAFAARLMFAGQLRARGYVVGLDDRGLPDGLDRALKYEAAPFLVDARDVDAAHLLIIGAEALSLAALDAIRAGRFGPATRVAALGRFADHQAAIGARSQIAYALGREPQIVDLDAILPRPLPAAGALPLAARLAPDPSPLAAARPALLVFVTPDQLRDPHDLAALDALAMHPGVALTVAITGRTAERQGRWPGGAVTVLTHADVPPVALAARADIAVVCGHGLADQRVAAAVLEVLGAGRPVIDCTDGASLVACGAPVLQGPARLGALPIYLDHAVLPNLPEIASLVAASGWLRDHALDRIETALDLTPPEPATPPPSGRTLFVPTNGVGLGHARRCVSIAAEMADPASCAFAAFPSCVQLVAAEGFACLPLVQKSPDHPEAYANDLLNYLRLGRLIAAGDTLVFDGGYIFDSIFRSILERRPRSVWIRRGLWQAGQSNERIIERSRVFDRVIVPDEAFEELNTSPGLDRHIRHVGPVVQDPQPEAGLRGTLSARFGRSFRQLVVTMLGGGAAADRTAQLQTLCNLFERREDCMHLIVVWPGAVVHPGLFGWRRSRVVRTVNALDLCRAGDLVITACGYNSFHEVLYHRLPAIFVPQMAAFMDDQERRARAAADRGLAETVAADDLLRLAHEVASFLDDGKAEEVGGRLARLALPPRGNAEAARLIAEVGKR